MTSITRLLSLSSLAILLFVSGCATEPKSTVSAGAETAQPTATLSIPYEMYQLDNGLNIILHQDKSDPIVAISTIVHVGSNREKPGRTGFAHFFEHMAFNDSENVPQGTNRTLIEELGGTRNGGTWADGTIYYEVVPKDAFNKLLWIDSDRLGFMIKTVNEGALEREKQVVKNEKRQRVDNRPYGHTNHVILKNLYPEGHPYNWTVIGDLEDLQAATLEDVTEFYDKYYGPANATVVIAGDIEIEETKELVEYWFGEIKASEPIEDLEPQPVTLSESKKLYHIDSFAKLPELRITFPTVEQYSDDSYALAVLSDVLSEGKRAPLYQVLVEEMQVAPEAWVYQSSSELAGTFTFHVRAKAGMDLDDVHSGIMEALKRFEQQGVSDIDLDIIKAQQETSFYEGISSVLNKAFQLGSYAEYAGSPDYITEDIERIKRVTKEDVMRVYKKYIKDKHFVMTSFVPLEQDQLIVDGSVKANVVEEKVVQGAEQEFDSNMVVEYEKTPTKNDRSEPPLGEPPLITIPTVESFKAANGMQVLNVVHDELPLVDFELRIDGGAWLESFDQLGVASLLAEWMNEGTKTKTPEQLQDAIGLLGAEINIYATRDSIEISGSTLSRNFQQTISLVSEMLLTPRWDEKEFERIKAGRLTDITQQYSQPFSIANSVFLKQLYGENNRMNWPTIGTSDSVSALTVDNVKTFYQRALSPKNAALHVVGDVSQEQINTAIEPLIKGWQGNVVELPRYESAGPIEQPKVFFVDVPDAKQSVIILGKIMMNGYSDDYYPFEVAQNRLGAGGSSRLFQTLRIEKGYTYGAYSVIRREKYFDAAFAAYSQVRTNVTLESLEVFRDLVGNYAPTLSQEDLDTTKNLLVKRNSRFFETTNNLVSMLSTMSKFDLPPNYFETQQAQLQAMSLKDAQAIYSKYANEQEMIYVIVGDAKTQLERIKDFGYGEPVVLDRDGNVL